MFPNICVFSELYLLINYYFSTICVFAKLSMETFTPTAQTDS